MGWLIALIVLMVIAISINLGYIYWLAKREHEQSTAVEAKTSNKALASREVMDKYTAGEYLLANKGVGRVVELDSLKMYRVVERSSEPWSTQLYSISPNGSSWIECENLPVGTYARCGIDEVYSNANMGD